MSQIAIRRAIEQRLHTMSPSLATAWENASFKPTPGIPYQRAEMVPGIPENPTMDSFTRELGFYQVTLMYPTDAGPNPAEARFELIKARFPKGLQITQDGVTVTISGTPSRGSGSPDGDRWSVPIRIPYYANIS
jgi:hypothetical protein